MQGAGGPHVYNSMQAAMDKPTLGWKRPRGRPRSTWLRAVEDDLKTVNLGLRTL